MEDILLAAKQMQTKAWSIIEEIDLVGHWASIGATINLVGSLKTGLMINNRDIDFHIYTNPFNDAIVISNINRINERVCRF